MEPYRAWDKRQNQMIYFDLFSSSLAGIVRGHDLNGNVMTSAKEDIIENVMPYTKQQDRNYRNIYVGDIIDKNSWGGGPCEIVDINGMYFSKPIGMPNGNFMEQFVKTYEECMSFIWGRTKEVSIIGNIYENKELIDKYTKEHIAKLKLR
jgi:hypothetical protein